MKCKHKLKDNSKGSVQKATYVPIQEKHSQAVQEVDAVDRRGHEIAAIDGENVLNNDIDGSDHNKESVILKVLMLLKQKAKPLT